MTNQGTLNETPIDLVYLWVDGSDSKWRNKKLRYQAPNGNYDKQSISQCRFFNNDELKYSLRSVEKYIPWINRIFIVTDEQIPAWLNTDHPKIKIIDHKDIIPTDKLPLFNSNAIESRIPFIPELSEHFLYANDDMFVWSAVKKEFFFPEVGKTYCRLYYIKLTEQEIYTQFRRLLYNAYNKVAKKYQIPISLHYPHHNIDAYLKSTFLNCIEGFKADFTGNLNHRFRDENDFPRFAVDYYALANGTALPRIIRKKNWFQKYILRQIIESQCYHFHGHKIQKLKIAKYNLLCLNDVTTTSNDDRKEIRTLLEYKFPEKSAFEL